jgi:hypothetical protein
MTFKQLIRFTNDAGTFPFPVIPHPGASSRDIRYLHLCLTNVPQRKGGLEKLLRLLQSLSHILVAWALNAEDAKLWIHLRRQFALGSAPSVFSYSPRIFLKLWMVLVP